MQMANLAGWLHMLSTETANYCMCEFCPGCSLPCFLPNHWNRACSSSKGAVAVVVLLRASCPIEHAGAWIWVFSHGAERKERRALDRCLQRFSFPVTVTDGL
jgi:hypothetical protein